MDFGTGRWNRALLYPFLVWTCWRAISCSGLHSKLAVYHVTWDVGGTSTVFPHVDVIGITVAVILPPSTGVLVRVLSPGSQESSPKSMDSYPVILSLVPMCLMGFNILGIGVNATLGRWSGEKDLQWERQSRKFQ